MFYRRKTLCGTFEVYISPTRNNYNFLIKKNQARYSPAELSTVSMSFESKYIITNRKLLPAARHPSGKLPDSWRLRFFPPGNEGGSR